MSLAIVYSRASMGVQAPLVTIEVHLSNGKPGFTLVGLPEKTVKEAQDRVRSALMNAQFKYPAKRITVNLAPADLPLDEQTKFYQLVEEENAKTIEALKAQQTDFEKGIELAMNAAHLFAKEDINNTSNKKAIYNPKQTRAKIEDKFGEHNVKSTTVVQNARSTVTERTLKTGESVQIIQSEGSKAIQVHSKPDEFGNTKLLANIPYDTRGLPVFDDVATFTAKIEKPKNYQNLSSKVRRELEMKNATLVLKQEIEQGKVNKNLFTQRQLEDIYSGKAQIDKYTWHHNAQSSPNNMQLLPTNIHDAVKHIGEASLSEGR